MIRTRLFLYAFVFSGFTLSACCLNCEETPPEKGTLNIEVSEEVTDSIELSVYKGQTVNGGTLVERDTIASDTSYILTSDHKYAGKAIYRKGGDQVIAIDRGEIEVKDKSDRDCADSVCYIPDDGTIDLELKKNPL